MYKYWIILFIFIGLVFAAGNLIYDYGVKLNHNKMIISWKVSNENNIKQFDVMRSNNDKDFTLIKTIAAKGSGEYTCSDEGVLGKSAHILYYKIQVRDRNNKIIEESNSFWVNINLSGIKSTWGAIKAMFR